jgi:hypothetical protein
MDRLREELKHLQEQYLNHPEVIAKMIKLDELQGAPSRSSLRASLSFHT